MIDFEDRLKDLLNERVDEKVGPQRPPAPFRPSTRIDDRTRGRRLVPLVAAACVAAVAAGSVGLTRLFADRTHTPPAGPTPAISTPHHSGPTPPPRYTPSTTPAPHTEAGTHTVHALGAILVLPDGWRLTGRRPVGAGIAPKLCIGKSGDSALQCPISISALHPEQTDPAYGFDVDAFDLARGDQPTLCGGGPERTRWAGAARIVGGRAAEWRSWDYTCPGLGRTIVFDQYTVVTTPGFLLELAAGVNAPFMTEISGAEVSGPQDIAALRRVVAAIARDSALPAQSAPLRLFDRGVVASMRRTGGTVTIVLHRVTRHVRSGHAVYAVENPGSGVTYVIPAGVVSTGSSIAVGSRIELTTDGTAVRHVATDR